jgi:hypothetical protein
MINFMVMFKEEYMLVGTLNNINPKIHPCFVVKRSLSSLHGHAYTSIKSEHGCLLQFSVLYA